MPHSLRNCVPGPMLAVLAGLLLVAPLSAKPDALERGQEVAAWMSAQEAPTTRAAGLLMRAAPGTGEARLSPDALLAELEGLISETSSGAALYLLAQACHALEVASRCVEAGLHRAIDRHDGGNPLAAGALFDPGSREFRETLVRARRVGDNLPAITLAVYEALGALDLEPRASRLVEAFALTLAHAMPALTPIVQTCGQAWPDDEELDRACSRIAAWMRDSRNSVFLQMVGFGVAAGRAEAKGRDDLAADYRLQRQALHDEIACLTAELPLDGSIDPDLEREFLQRWMRDGELAGQRFLARSLGIECPAS